MAQHTEPHLQPDSAGQWVGRLFKGVAVGVGAILPGLSGGVLAVIFRLYDPLIRFLANMRKDFVRNALFFLPVFIGAGLGWVGFSAVVAAAFGQYAAQFTCLFIGFVVGTFPSLWRAAGERGRKPVHVVTMLVAAAALFGLMLLGASEQELLQVEPSLPVWIASGAMIGLGVVVPGLSPSNFLIYFGLYDKMATEVKNLNIPVIICLVLGVAVCVLLLAKATKWAFDRYYATMYHFILGTVVGSSVAIFPTVVFPAFTPSGLAQAKLSLPAAVIFAALLLVAGIIASYLFSKVEDRVTKDRG